MKSILSGRYDLAVIIRVKDNEELAEIVTDRMLKTRYHRFETLILSGYILNTIWRACSRCRFDPVPRSVKS